MQNLDIQKCRQDTPSTSKYIHFNNAGSSLPPQQVIKKVIDYLKEESEFGGYEMAEKYTSELSQVYTHIANFINAKTPEIAITQSATSAWNAIFYAIDWQKGDKILTSLVEYSSNFLSYLQISENKGIEIEIIPSDEFGQIDIEALEKQIDEKTRAICLTHIPSNGGLVNPAEEVGKIAKKHNLLFLLDACQSLGQMPIDVEKLGCDMLSATGRKYLRAPRGTGFLYIRKSLLEKITPSTLDTFSAEWINAKEYKIRQDARKFETWERNHALHLGLVEAIKYAQDIGMHNIWQRIQYLGQILREKLNDIPQVKVQDLGKIKGGIVTFTVENQTPNFIKTNLLENNIHVSIAAKTSALLDANARSLDELVRASVHYYNTEDEIEGFCKIIKSLF